MKQVYSMFNLGGNLLRSNRKWAMTFLLMFSFWGVSQAQVDISIGTGTGSSVQDEYPCPVQDFFEGSRMQFLYLASELQGAGMGPGTISAVKFTVTNLNGAGVIEQHTIRIGSTAATSLANNSWEPGTVQVYGPVNYQPVNGVNTFAFSNSFFWNGTDNLIIEICGGDPNSTAGITWTANPSIIWTTGLNFNGSHTYRADNLDYLCNTTNTANSGQQSTRPNAIFSWTAAASCSGTPNAGTASANPNIVCLNQPFTLSASGFTVASGLTYQWQQSTDNITFTDIVGATSIAYVHSQSVTSYYRLKITCNNTPGGVATSNTITVSSPTLVNGNFTINNALPTGGSNFNSFNDAYNYIKCGINGPVTFNVDPASGPYVEQLIISAVPGASANNTVTFNGNGRSIQYISTVGNERAVIKLNGADFIRFDNLVVNALGTATTEFGFGFHLINNADSNVINNCRININTTSISQNYAGIVVSGVANSAIGTGTAAGCDSNRISNNIITGGYYGVTMVSNVGSTAVANLNNLFENNEVKDFYQYGLYVTTSSFLDVKGNRFHRPDRATVIAFTGIYFNGLSIGAKIHNNRIYNPFGGNSASTADFNGIHFNSNDGFSGFENRIYNNVIYNITGNGNVNGLHNNNSDNVLYYHNTIHLDGAPQNQTASNFTRAFYQTTLASAIELKNNLFTISRSGTSTKHFIYLNTATTSITSDYNNFYYLTSTGVNNIAFVNGTPPNQLTTLPAWRTFSQQDANSIQEDPAYANLLAGNLAPTSASMDNLGTASSITDDINGNVRNLTTPDMGAYEFAPAPCVTPPTGGVSYATPGEVCQNTLVSLSLSGNSTGLGQTYQWEASTNIAGPYLPLTAPQNRTGLTTIATVSQYYRAAVACSSSVAYSTPVLLLVNPALPGGTYTINQNLPTTPLVNYNSFAAAKLALNCGIAGPVVFNVVAGTGPYVEQMVLDSIPGTTAINTITFKGNGNIIQFVPTVTTERAVLKLRTTDHIIFDSLVIDVTQAGSTYGFGVQMFNDADSNIVRNCTILLPENSTSTAYSGVVINSSETSALNVGNAKCDGNIVFNNTIRGGYSGINCFGAIGTPIFNNEILDNNILDFNNAGIFITGNSNAKVERNRISRPNRTQLAAFNGINVGNGNNNLLVNKNRIFDPFVMDNTATQTAVGIAMNNADADVTTPNIISNNLIYDFKSEGTQTGIQNAGSDNGLYAHNTIALDFVAGTSGTALTRGFAATSSTIGLVLKNNIITIFRGGLGEKHGIYLSNITSADIVSNRNDVLVENAFGNNFFGFYGVSRLNLAAWQSATGLDANSVSINPVYSNPAIGDYSPTIGAIDNIGEPVGIPDDINSIARNSSTPDIGAYEFAVPPCVTPPNAGSATAIPNSGICLGYRINLNLTGNTVGGGQTYQWQTAPTANGPWSNIGNALFTPVLQWETTLDTFFRCIVVCNGTSADTSNLVQIALNPAFLSGYYTINPALPATLPNFQNFTSAVAALECGITGFVTFDVAPGTYSEQIRMHRIAGAGPNSRVTFRSANGFPASVNLTWSSSVAAQNYTLLLDSAQYITYSNMTISASDDVNGRAVVLANIASYDSIVNCIVTAPEATANGNALVGIYGAALRGTANVFKGNTIQGGAQGIALSGTSAANIAYDFVIDSNLVSGNYQNGINVTNMGRIQVNQNNIQISDPHGTPAYGITATGCDSAFIFKGNWVHISDVSATNTYGIYLNSCDGTQFVRGQFVSNKVTCGDNNTGNIYGLYFTANLYARIANNVSSVKTNGATSFAAFYQTGGGCLFLNNSLLNASGTGTPNNSAANISQSGGAAQGQIIVRNNIFAHTADGRALMVTNLGNVNLDYNMYYTTGSTLVFNTTANSFATLEGWRNFSYWDLNSISYMPIFSDPNNLTPDLTNPDVWAMHGRGTQIVGNNVDFNQNPRPTTYTEGVPDLGAYEFLPTSLPTLLTGIPAVPAPGTTQTFMYGTDTVAKITYSPSAPVPASINLRRYSGVLPTGLTAGQQSMYFYTDFDVSAQGAYKYDIKQYYIDPWRGFIPTEPQTNLGIRDVANTWGLSGNSTVETFENVLRDTGLVHFDQFTGLLGNSNAQAPPYITVIDSSNRGTRFWVPYGNHYSFSQTNSQDMWLYLSAEDSANVTVRVNGTNWKRTYAIPAGTVTVSDIMPKSGLIDARILNEGLNERGISITSDVPIVAYAHIYDGATSGASMLLPVGTYGYEYQSLNNDQFYSNFSYTWTSIISDRDSSLVEIIPAVDTRSGRPAGVPFTVLLMQGEVYTVMGTIINNSSAGTDISGTRIKSIPNANGKCFPIAVFSGSTRTSICAGGGDNIIQQVFPSQAWGKKYLSFGTATSGSTAEYNANQYRVMVKDTATNVTVNGVLLPRSQMRIPGNFYPVTSPYGSGVAASMYIEADQPVMVAQYMISSGATGCPGLTAPGLGDPEMIYISPIEQGIKKAAFYTTNENSISFNYINVVIPTAGLTSLVINGTTTFTDVFTHPFLAGYSCVRHNLGNSPQQNTISSDSSFTAITYGIGSVESYGYNAGTLVKNLNALPAIQNTLGTTSTSDYTCVKAPFRFKIQITAKPQMLTWYISGLTNITPNADVIQNNPPIIDSSFINGRWYYQYTVPTDYVFTQPGTYYLTILVKDSLTIEGCENTQEVILPITVLDAPFTDFTLAFSGCLGAPVVLSASGSTPNGTAISSWNWNFGDNNTGTGQNTSYTYTAPGTYNINLAMVSVDGCLGDTTKQVIVNALPAVEVVDDSLIVCGNAAATFEILNPDPNTTYNWYTTASGGSPVFTGPVYTLTNVNGFVEYFVEAINASGCISDRRRVVANVLPNLTAPIVRVDSLGTNLIRFIWDPVPGALTYEVSIDNGATWVIPSSGATGLTHTVTGLNPGDEVTLIVRATGTISCQVATSEPFSARALLDQIYIPNSFTPNGDGLNDLMLVYGYTIQSMKFLIFNQWGEKIFESTNQSTGWDGTFKGKPQPSGVYMYVSELILKDGTVVNKKGSINLVR